MSGATILIGDIHALAGRSHELAAELGELARHARATPGCAAYLFTELPDDAGHYVLAQEWDDEASLQAHYASPAYARYRQRVGDLLARPSELRLHRVASTVRLADPGPLDPRRAD